MNGCDKPSPRRYGVLGWLRRVVYRADRVGTRRRYLSILERVMVTPRSGLLVVRFEGETLLVGVSERRIDLLRHLPANGDGEHGGDRPICG